MTAPTLPFPARRSDPITSQRAACSSRVTLRGQVREVLAARPKGMTDWEITEALGLPDRRKPSVAKRRQELGCVPRHWPNSAEVMTRRSPDLRDCIVWVLPEGER